ncbi:hypothetical protein [Citricoccus sp.]|uniref:hypothetical protein n=1 Tax=Citricoccus sp. TaxID=1978372 RepID=UPI0028BD5CF4|nr:hypothetical protein [Citricoccus sp.]
MAEEHASPEGATPRRPASTGEPSDQSSAMDLLTVILLSLMAVLTAWCGFQASKWGGEMSIAFSQASGARIQAASAEGTARDARQYDLSIYTEWVLATADGRDNLAGFIENRFTPEFRTAFDVWIAENEGGGPLMMQEGGPMALEEYVPPGTRKAEELSALADTRFQEALEHNQRGDNYSLLTVVFALVLFLTAMSQRRGPRWARMTLLGLGVVVAVGCFAIMVTFPVKI